MIIKGIQPITSGNIGTLNLFLVSLGLGGGGGVLVMGFFVFCFDLGFFWLVYFNNSLSMYVVYLERLSYGKVSQKHHQ